jgi:hypothetical protein
MWLFNEIGFFSVVRKPLAGSKVNVIQVRGRTVDDLKRLKGSCKLKEIGRASCRERVLR